MQRAILYRRELGREVEAAGDYLAVLRSLEAPGATGSREVRAAASDGLWELQREFSDPRQLDAAKHIAAVDPERGFEALSRYAQTHPCAWTAQVELGRLALARQRFDLATKLLREVRWLFPDDPAPHFVYGQALAALGEHEPAVRALEHALKLAPDDADVMKWIAFAKSEMAGVSFLDAPTGVSVSMHIARSIIVLRGVVWQGRVYPAVINLSKVPGDLAMAYVVQTAGSRDHAALNAADADQVMRSLVERTSVSDYSGQTLSLDQTVGDLADPGVVVLIVYEAPMRDAAGLIVFDPLPIECRTSLFNSIAQDGELWSKLDRHLKSADATLKARLDL
jgi:tetratricopeptide (TPR) repeat protein